MIKRKFVIAFSNLLVFSFLSSAYSADLIGIQGSSREAVVNAKYNVSGNPLLNTFKLNFLKTDHHIRTISVKPASPIPDPLPESTEPRPDTIELIYRDISITSAYAFEISHYDHLDNRITRGKVSDFCKSTCSRMLNKPIGDYVFAITGFSFDFPGVNHHIDEIGIIESNGEVKVSFNDKNDDDLFKFTLDYSYIPRDLIQQQGSVNRVNAKGSASVRIPFGQTIIQGFTIDYSNKDHELKVIGVLARQGMIDVEFGDKGHDDKFNFAVKWAILDDPLPPQPEDDPPQPQDDPPEPVEDTPICQLKPYLPQCL